jgi:hypothetical protein
MVPTFHPLCNLFSKIKELAFLALLAIALGGASYYAKKLLKRLSYN